MQEPDTLTMTLEEAAGQKLLLAFVGREAPPAELLAALQALRPAGVTLFRENNVDTPAQVRALTAALQAAARQAGLPPLLIAADQEGGQLLTVGEGATQLPGNLALGAAGSVDLAFRAGLVLGTELAAMGINVNYAPAVDVANNPRNPVIGTRSFGEQPGRVAALGAALGRGLQSAGVAAAAKHFPGHGDTDRDSHCGTPIINHNLEHLRQVEFPPFHAAIQSGVKLVLAAHLALPQVSGRSDLPATLSPFILRGVLRAELGFEGVIVTDAMDMLAIRQGEALGLEAVCACAAGADLLLMTADAGDQRRVYAAVLQAAQRGLLKPGDVFDSAARVLRLKNWLAAQPPQPPLELVGCAEHRQVADEIANRSITLVRDQANLVPLRLNPGQSLAVVMFKPENLTPADTSALETPALGDILRRYHPNVDEFTLPHAPGEQDIRAIRQLLRGYDRVVIGTLNAYTQAGQAELVQAVQRSGLPVIVAALRMPYDLAAFPDIPTYLCAYSILEPSLRALARVLVGELTPRGRLPVSIPGLYPVGHPD